MYYLEMIQRFWSFNESQPIGSTAISMYLYLLKTGYVNDRYDFKISDVAIAKDLGLTRKTVKSAKQKLQSSGLIRYESQNGVPCYYRLIVHYPFVKPDCQKEKVVKKEPTIDVRVEAEQETVSRPLGKSIVVKNVPDIDEFLDYALTLDTYEPKLDSFIKDKHKSWLNDNWQNSAGRPITNWKSLLKSIIPYMKSSEIMDLSAADDIPKITRPDLK